MNFLNNCKLKIKRIIYILFILSGIYLFIFYVIYFFFLSILFFFIFIFIFFLLIDIACKNILIG